MAIIRKPIGVPILSVSSFSHFEPFGSITMSYPPRQGEEFELTSPTNNHAPLAGPSRPKHRTLTLHPSTSTSALLFSAPQQSPRRRSSHHDEHPTRRRPHFLQDDHTTEEVHVPDLGHMLGIDDNGEDHFAVASNMRSVWKKRLYLLMEEPSSGREAFVVHILVTGAILFR